MTDNDISANQNKHKLLENKVVVVKVSSAQKETSITV